MTITNGSGGSNIIPPLNFDLDFATPSDFAGYYRACGWQVVPAWSPAEHKQWKRPRLGDWKRHQRALVDEPTYCNWYGAGGEHRERANMGILTGPCSGNRFVIDLDTYKSPAAAAWWKTILDLHNNGLDLETVEQVTGGGGQQKVFAAPTGYAVPTYRTPTGVDVRGQGGFAMLAPSLHESGRNYAWKAGCAPWEIAVAPAPAWLLDEIAALGKTVKGEPPHPAGGGSDPRPPPSNGAEPEFTAFGRRIDGREQYMSDLVFAALVGLRMDNPIGRPPDAEMERIWTDYERNCAPKHPVEVEGNAEGLEREGRGRSAFAAKWADKLREWDGVIAEAAMARAGRERADKADFGEKAEAAAEQAAAQEDIYELLDTNQILALPDPVWLIDGLIGEEALGFIFGPPGCLKTFMALGMALSWVTRQTQWWGRSINRHGAVIYISSEGHRSLKFRLLAWARHHGAGIAGTPFFLLRESLDFMKPADIGKLLATVESAVTRAGIPIAAIFVDTVSKVLPGAEENLQKDMTLFVDGCAKLRERFHTVVVGLHHTNAAGGFRGSTVIPGAGDFMIEVKREPGAKGGSILAKKIKDAPDGWEQYFQVLDVPCTSLGAQTSLVLTPAQAPPAKKFDWPEKDVCRRILADIAAAWQEGKPWSAAPQSGDRYAPRILFVKLMIPAKAGREMIDTWLINGVLTTEISDLGTKARGLRVTGSID